MKIIVQHFFGHSEVCIRGESGVNLHMFTFATRQEVTAFLQGFTTAQHVACQVVKRIPTNPEIIEESN